MRTIKKSLYNRMRAQADEAKTIGLTKLAKALDEQIAYTVEFRGSDEFYVYPDEDFKSDVERSFWNAAVRTADFYDKSFDAKEVNELIEKAASDFVNDLRLKMGVNHGIGAYEPNVPGEVISGRVVIELDEE